jgi:hypothetical protein
MRMMEVLRNALPAVLLLLLLGSAHADGLFS